MKDIVKGFEPVALVHIAATQAVKDVIGTERLTELADNALSRVDIDGITMAELKHVLAIANSDLFEQIKSIRCSIDQINKYKYEVRRVIAEDGIELLISEEINTMVRKAIRKRISHIKNAIVESVTNDITRDVKRAVDKAVREKLSVSIDFSILASNSK